MPSRNWNDINNAENQTPVGLLDNQQIVLSEKRNKVGNIISEFFFLSSAAAQWCKRSHLFICLWVHLSRLLTSLELLSSVAWNKISERTSLSENAKDQRFSPLKLTNFISACACAIEALIKLDGRFTEINEGKYFTGKCKVRGRITKTITFVLFFCFFCNYFPHNL